jgi:hypothetical protein
MNFAFQPFIEFRQWCLQTPTGETTPITLN